MIVIAYTRTLSNAAISKLVTLTNKMNGSKLGSDLVRVFQIPRKTVFVEVFKQTYVMNQHSLE